MKTIASMDVSSVKSVRKMSGLSQRKFAAKYGIPVSTVEAWERGLREPTPYLLALLAFRVAYDIGVSEEGLRTISDGIL